MSGRVFEEVERERARELSKAAFEEQGTALRVALVEAQRALANADFPAIVLFAGVDGGGKGETVNLLTEWLDPRRIVTHAYDRLTEEEGQRPEFWRYWRDLPERGRLGLFLSAWYSAPLVDRAYGRIGKAALDRRLARIAAFERTLADDGALILKFWMHLDRNAQQKRLESLQKHPRDHWRISEWDWRNWHRYEQFVDAAEHIITGTSTAGAPWLVVDGRHARYRSLTALRMVHRALDARLAGRPSPAAGFQARARAAAASPAAVGATVRKVKPLATIDRTRTVGRKVYEKSLAHLRGELYWLAAQNLRHGLSVVLVFEGWDAGGKGGAIRRMVSALDARSYRVHQVAAPSDEERAHHYLWRFWRRLPEAGQLTVFDRSWYGRVLVERVESFATEAEWQRAYAEIRDFEEQLTGHGTLLMKFWLHIDKDEQERRFLARKDNPYKSWKLTDEDWRNRAKWEAYEDAANDMIASTSTRDAPWTLVPGNCKRHARIEVLRSLCAALEKRLKQRAAE